MSTTGGVPQDASVMSPLETLKTGASATVEGLEVSPLLSLDSSAIFRDMTAAIRQCNRSTDKDCVIVKWSEVKGFLEQGNPTYKDIDVDKLKNKYKYLKRLKKRIR